MSHIHRYGEQIATYREQTARQASCPGATKPSFTCRRCQQSRGTAGRKIITKGYTRGGYLCAQCVKGVS